MPKKYLVRQPDPIEAVQYNGNNFDEIKNFVGCLVFRDEDTGNPLIDLGYEVFLIKHNDYILKTPDGVDILLEEVFEEMYEEVK